MLNIIACSMAGMDWITLVKKCGGQEKRTEGLRQQVLTSVKPTEYPKSFLAGSHWTVEQGCFLWDTCFLGFLY